MAEAPLYSSPGSIYDRHQLIQDQENLGSSPLHSNTKQRRPPTVTPKRFRKFFEPKRSLTSRGQRQSKAARALRDVTKHGANRRRQPAHTQDAEHHAVPDRSPKRRKLSFNLDSSPPRSSPLKRVQPADDFTVFEDEPLLPPDEVDMPPFAAPPKPVKRIRQGMQSLDLVQRSFGEYCGITHGRREPQHCVNWQAETANFCSVPADLHSFAGTALPFCTASCNTNSMVAIGEEEGGIRFVDSARFSDFSKQHVRFRPHHNAIMDLAFSRDDYMLATASGDQTARIIDMHTQQTICIMSGHTSSVKQVRFHPSDDNIITTSSRDGSVQIWDMRCGGKGSIASLRTAFARDVDTGATEPSVQYPKHSFQLALAHRPTLASSGNQSNDAGVSITSIQHLPHGREHLLVTASEVNSSIKLWDLRNTTRRGPAVPVSSTRIPESHITSRNFGINSMVFSSDGARLFATCRDGGVYAYSTSHLILGCAPELSPSSNPRSTRPSKPGIGPLYTYKHEGVRIGTFYVKSAIRSARGDKSEMLAVGSSNNCAVLFPTDERHLPVRERPSEDNDEADLPSDSPVKINERTAAFGLPTFKNGTSLIQGHSKEVTSLTWTHDGDLMTVGDDFTARCWREDATRARELRTCGERGGQRWRCGWADVDAAWDEDDDL